MRRRFGWLIGAAALLLPLTGVASPPPVTQSVTVQASVCAPGSVTPLITSPTTGSTSTNAVITVSGTATANQAVTVYRNSIAAGTTITDALGGFSLSVTLTVGNNALVAQSCTQSPTVTVTYAPPTPPGPTPGPPKPAPRPNPVKPGGAGSGPGQTPGSGEAVDATGSLTDRQGTSEVAIDPVPSPPGQAGIPATFYVLVGPDVLEGAVGQLMELPFAIFGGTGPFTIRTLAGDGSELTVVATDRSLLFRHSYATSGRFPILLEVTDAEGRRAVVESVIRIGGTAPVPSGTSSPDHSRLALGLIFALELLGLAGVFAVWEYCLRNRHHADA